MEDQKKPLICPLCQGTEFQKELGKIDSEYGVTAHQMTIMICKSCNFVMLFSRGNTIWDFD